MWLPNGCMCLLQTLDKRPEQHPGLIGCGKQLHHVLRVPPLEAFKTWLPRGPGKMTPSFTRSSPQLTRCHIPTEWHLLPSKNSLFHKCRYLLCSMTLSYPRRRLTPLPMRRCFGRGAQNPETTRNGQRGSAAGTRKSQGA